MEAKDRMVSDTDSTLKGAKPMAANVKKTRPEKYPPNLLIKAFRIAAASRNEMLAARFTDNGGAIHSAERILNILGMRLNYPDLSHQNNLKHLVGAEFSVEAKKLHKAGEKVLIEHVAPVRHLTQMAIDKIVNGASDAQFKAFLRKHYRLVLLSATETKHLNKHNRSTVTPDRLGEVGIKLAKPRF